MTGAIGSHHARTKKTTDEWITPRWIIDALGPFDLDPCAAEIMPWRTAARMISERENGLIARWQGFVWCNPPYGQAVGRWLGRMAEHRNGVALIFARTETEAFFQTVWREASALLFLEGRLTFHHADGSWPSRARGGGNAGGPSVLIAYGGFAAGRLNRLADRGALVTAWCVPRLTPAANDRTQSEGRGAGNAAAL